MAKKELTLPTLSEHFKIPYQTLVTAARQQRLRARKVGPIWISTEADVQAALDTGQIRPRNRKE
jgi:hypothetical protein